MAGAGFFGAPRPRLANAFVRPCVNNGERQRCYAWDALASRRVRAPGQLLNLAPRPRRKGRLRQGREAGATKERPLLANSFRARTDQEHQGVDVNRSPGRHWSGRFWRIAPVLAR